MAFIVTEACIRCKFQDCVQSCPVTCFHEGANMLVIDPEACIDCGACVPECPTEAIIRDTAPEAGKWLAFNRKYAALWPAIREPGDIPGDANDWIDVEGKLAEQFSPEPASR